VEECKALVMERVGVELEVKLDAQLNKVTFTSPGREFTIWDYPVELWVSFRDDGTIWSLDAEGIIYIQKKELEGGWKAFVAEHLQNTLAMIERATENYGEVISGTAKNCTNWENFEHIEEDTYSLLINNGVPDTNVLSEILTEDFEYIWVDYDFRAGISISISPYQVVEIPDSTSYIVLLIMVSLS